MIFYGPTSCPLSSPTTAWLPHCNQAIPACWRCAQRGEAFRLQILLDEGSRRVWVAVRWLYRPDEVEAGILPTASLPAEREQAVFFSTWDDVVDAAALLHPVKVPTPLPARSLVARRFAAGADADPRGTCNRWMPLCGVCTCGKDSRTYSSAG